MGALYTQMSICILRENKENRENLERIQQMITNNGTLMKARARAISEYDQNLILDIFRLERL